MNCIGGKKEASKNIPVIHGTNLNLLCRRKPHIYGHKELSQINQDLINEGNRLGFEVECFQSNYDFMVSI